VRTCGAIGKSNESGVLVDWVGVEEDRDDGVVVVDDDVVVDDGKNDGDDDAFDDVDDVSDDDDDSIGGGGGGDENDDNICWSGDRKVATGKHWTDRELLRERWWLDDIDF